MACLAEQHCHICSAADGRAIFGKSLLSQVQLVLLFFSPSLINALIPPQLLLFLEMRFLFLLQGHDPKDPQSLTHLYTLRAPAFLSSFSPHLSDQSHHAFCQGGLWNTRTNVAKATGLKTRLQEQMLYNLGFPSFAFKGSRATASKQAKSLKLKMRGFFFFNCHLMSLSS